MKNRIAVAIASLLFASLGTAAYAQAPQQTNTPPSSATPTYNPDAMPASSSTAGGMSGDNGMSNGSMSGGSMSDQQMEQKIKHALTSHGITATNVDVSFSNGTATLSGTVFKHADIAKAKKDAMRVKGVKHVDTSGLHAGAASSSSPGSSG